MDIINIHQGKIEMAKYYMSTIDIDNIRSDSEIMTEIRQDFDEDYNFYGYKTSEKEIVDFYGEVIRDHYILVPTSLSKFCKNDKNFVSKTLGLILSGQKDKAKLLIDKRLRFVTF